MMKSLPNAVDQVRRQRRTMLSWIITGVAYYTIILAQALASVRQAEATSLLQSYPMLIVTLVFIWGISGLLVQNYFGNRRPN